MLWLGHWESHWLIILTVLNGSVYGLVRGLNHKWNFCTLGGFFALKSMSHGLGLTIAGYWNLMYYTISGNITSTKFVNTKFRTIWRRFWTSRSTLDQRILATFTLCCCHTFDSSNLFDLFYFESECIDFLFKNVFQNKTGVELRLDNRRRSKIPGMYWKNIDKK